MEDQTFDIAGFTTQSGAAIDLQIAYRVHGALNAARDNLIVYPTYYAGRSEDNDFLIGAGMALDPSRDCIVVPNLFGNGASSSPSNAPAPYSASRFPRISYHDNVACQRELVRSVFGVERVRLVVGFSMGAMQAYEWAVQAPDAVERIAAICGSARTYEHNQLFLDAICAALEADSAFKGGKYDAPPKQGLDAFCVSYAAWFASQQFYSEQIYRSAGFGSVQDVVDLGKAVFTRHDANDLLAMASTWRAGDVSANPTYGGDFEAAMRAIRARALVMPCDTDLYFRLRDNEREVALLSNAKLAPIRSDFGHLAGGGFDPAAVAFMNAELSQLLAASA